MKTLLLDASVLIAAFDGENTHHEAARSMLVGGNETLETLDFTRYEVANAALRLWRLPEKVRPLLEAVDEISEDGGMVASSSQLLSRASELAEQFNLTVYDAAYVAASRSRGRTLVSCDVRDLVSQGLAKLPSEVAAG